MPIFTNSGVPVKDLYDRQSKVMHGVSLDFINTPVILIITRFLLVEVTVKNDFLKEILGTFKERIKTEISSEVIAYVEQ